MDLQALPWVWAQSQPPAASPNSMALMALRRWFSSLTLSSPESIPDHLHPLLAFLGRVGFPAGTRAHLSRTGRGLEAALRPARAHQDRSRRDPASMAGRPFDRHRHRLHGPELDGQPGAGLHEGGCSAARPRHADQVARARRRSPSNKAFWPASPRSATWPHSVTT